MSFENVNISATVYETVEEEIPGSSAGGNGGAKLTRKVKKKKVKPILKNLTGRFCPGQFTALMGPSGSGKTTLMNYLSGRYLSDNLKISGTVKVNQKEIETIDKYSSLISYVMQEDCLVGWLTPRETFKYSADFHLVNKTDAQKMELVDQIIKVLGL